MLAAGLRGVADDYGVEVADDAVARFSVSVRDWPAFADSRRRARAGCTSGTGSA